ncbi:MAG: hypothetical protein K0R05_2807 [Anaerocolumna sp.]|jgi:hypothetical protein|nr:hypothetical protein [Clostridia bacterium]MDF2871232.1 hypothetical protein [Anaerocolumna sp.]
MSKDWIRMIPKITEHSKDNHGVQCPNCGEYGIDYLYVGDEKTRIGYLQIWCRKCLKGIYVSRAIAPPNAKFATFDEDLKEIVPKYEFIND